MPEPRIGELDARFSSPDGSATSWDDVERTLDRAEIFWLSTVRPDGRPHATPLIAAWLDGALHFGTGPGERKEMNLRANRHCVATTGCNAFRQGLDVIVEGDAERVRDEATLRRLADRFDEKYAWSFEVAGGTLREVLGPEPSVEASRAPTLVFRIPPAKIFAYARGGSFTATRWRL
jgi:nitroimidazol reductase NimA-like FMN-containing flavoprotein (pyridoxamine 5'-phosphate oxidase superfamily)